MAFPSPAYNDERKGRRNSMRYPASAIRPSSGAEESKLTTRSPVYATGGSWKYRVISRDGRDSSGSLLMATTRAEGILDKCPSSYRQQNRGNEPSATTCFRRFNGDVPCVEIGSSSARVLYVAASRQWSIDRGGVAAGQVFRALVKQRFVDLRRLSPLLLPAPLAPARLWDAEIIPPLSVGLYNERSTQDRAANQPAPVSTCAGNLAACVERGYTEAKDVPRAGCARAVCSVFAHHDVYAAAGVSDPGFSGHLSAGSAAKGRFGGAPNRTARANASPNGKAANRAKCLRFSERKVKQLAFGASWESSFPHNSAEVDIFVTVNASLVRATRLGVLSDWSSPTTTCAPATNHSGRWWRGGSNVGRAGDHPVDGKPPASHL
ncbi:hypothetical protein MRX96_030969 [Rhipicephalus microplus]